MLRDDSAGTIAAPAAVQKDFLHLPDAAQSQYFQFITADPGASLPPGADMVICFNRNRAGVQLDQINCGTFMTGARSERRRAGYAQNGLSNVVTGQDGKDANSLRKEQD
jgi:hypothetical protein